MQKEEIIDYMKRYNAAVQDEQRYMTQFTSAFFIPPKS